MSDVSAQAASQLARLAADTGAQRVARVYAESLLGEAEKFNVVEEIRQELDDLLNQVAGGDDAVRNFFTGGLVGRDRRREAISKAFGGKVSPLFLNFLLVVNDHERLELLRPILAVYSALVQERSNQVRVQVQTAVPLPDDQRERLIGQLRQLTKKEPVLIASVDPALLGGIVVQVGDWRYDASVRQQLDIIRNQLIESSSHEIQSGRDRFSSAG